MKTQIHNIKNQMKLVIESLDHDSDLVDGLQYILCKVDNIIDNNYQGCSGYYQNGLDEAIAAKQEFEMLITLIKI